MKPQKYLLKKYNSKVPETIEELITLPGVGHKTASVVINQTMAIQLSRSTPIFID